MKCTLSNGAQNMTVESLDDQEMKSERHETKTTTEHIVYISIMPRCRDFVQHEYEIFEKLFPKYDDNHEFGC